jgi:hypothetical protein
MQPQSIRVLAPVVQQNVSSHLPPALAHEMMPANACCTLPQTHFAMLCRHDQEIMFGCEPAVQKEDGMCDRGAYDHNTKETHYNMITREGKVSDNDFNSFLPKCHVRSKRVLLNLLCVIVRSCELEIASKSCERRRSNRRVQSCAFARLAIGPREV